MATDFYLTLPSNALYPDNMLAHYNSDLPQRIDLSGEWDCGLAEIQYTHTWYNIGAKDTWFFLDETIALVNIERAVKFWILQDSHDIDEPCQQGTGQYDD